MPIFQSILTALVAGGIPALIWLFFWLKEDSKHPEPKKMLSIAFLLGMASAFLVLPFEQLVYSVLPELSSWSILLIVILEEIFKLSAAFAIPLRSKAYDEPIDAVVYMVTVALGFTAIENAFFLFTPISNGDVFTSLMTGNMRFIGATLLHIISSGSIGICMAFAFYKKTPIKIGFIFYGLLVAIALHTIFNLIIINGNLFIIYGFIFVWIWIVVMMLFFEKIKTIINK